MLILKKIERKDLEKAYDLKPNEVIEKIKKSNLLGRGGAVFPTGLKWELTAKEKGEKYLICNADEGEPGTFKDKLILSHNPELLIEGILLASYALGVKKAYIYLRREYVYLKEKVKKAINKANKRDVSIKIIDGAGAYICGDETAIMNSIEGDRGYPRKKPPFPAQKGLFNKPTCINNVETLASVPLIFSEDKWHKNLRLFSISGDVKKGGVFEESLNSTFKSILDKAEPKEPIKALFFGASGGCIPYKDEYIFSFEELKKMGAWLGSCTVIVVGKSTSIVDVCLKMQEFFVHESCGKCVPCREGNYQLLKLLEKFNSKKAKREDVDLMERLANTIVETSFCGLGQAAGVHLLTSLKYFKDEFIQRCK